MDPYDQAVMDYLPAMERMGKSYQRVRGAYCPTSFGPKGLDLLWAIWPNTAEQSSFLGQKSNASLLAANMIMRYHLTGDRDYARKIAYPFVRSVVSFWEDYLVLDQSGATDDPGRYVVMNDCINEVSFFMQLPLGSKEQKRALDVNPPYTLGLVRMITTAAIDMSTDLGVDAKLQAKWRDMIARLSRFPVTVRNGLPVFDVKEIGSTSLESTNMCSIQHIYPANAISLSSDPALVQTAVNTITFKNLWENTNSFSTIFAAAARVGYDPQVILDNMLQVSKKRMWPNFAFKFGGGGIENEAGVPGGLNEMMLQSHEGILRIFPCWPKGRPASFSNIRAYGAFLVNARTDGASVIDVSILSDRGAPCIVMNPWLGKSVQVRQEGKPTEVVAGDRITISTVAGACYNLTPMP